MMMFTLSKNVKYREEKESVFIADCKNLRDFKVNKEFLPFFGMLRKGLAEKGIANKREKLLFNDLKKMRLLAPLQFNNIHPGNYAVVKDFLQRNLYLEYPGLKSRGFELLLHKLKEYPDFFIGLYLDKELIGVVQGFPREDYLLMSEIAIEKKFRSRDFGELLAAEFERRARKKGFKKIKAGAQDKAIDFYKRIKYKPSVLVQIKKRDAPANLAKLLKKYKILAKVQDSKNILVLELACPKSTPRSLLKKLEKEFNAFSTQYIFTKNL